MKKMLEPTGTTSEQLYIDSTVPVTSSKKVFKGLKLPKSEKLLLMRPSHVLGQK